ncbi:fucolectin-4-like [Erpetoichthys calabaricus]|uniref:Fucolectin-4-like n=1 Tax=Erpetoichthys calabaricus TaxID=27687 RepID=A0A8C4SPE1_ERPCA|nr:fucolectin-4-like [Erpetoichthys calabaricus]
MIPLILISVIISLCGASDDSCPEVDNVALYGRATMSQSYSFLGLASNAIDGNRDGTYIHGSCAHTANHLNPWWRVDLLKSYKVKLIVLTSREDCCPEQINGAEILIGDSLKNDGNINPRCAVVQNLGTGMTIVYHCNGMVGRYVNVVKPDKTESIVFSELEVYGTPVKH